MGQDCTTSLKTNSAARSRVVAHLFKVDWTDLGWSNYANWTGDESAHVLSYTGELQSLNWQMSMAAVGYGMVATARVTCRNPTEAGHGRRFSPTNTSGNLYAYLGDGKANMKRAVIEMGFYNSGTPERTRQISGYITRLTDNAGEGTVTFEIKDRGADALLSRSSTVLMENELASTYLTALVGALGRDPPPGTLFDNGRIQVPYYWMDDETVWEELGTVAEAHAGRVWFDKDGILHWDDAAHWVRPQSSSWDNPLTEQAAFTVASFSDLSPAYDMQSVYNDIIVEYAPRYVAASQPIFTASEIIALKPSESAHVYKASFNYPSTNIEVPVAGVDYTAITSGGSDITANVSISGTYLASHADLEFTNSNTTLTAYVTKLQIRGTPLMTLEPTRYEVDDPTSVGLYGRRTYTIRTNPYIQTWRHAQFLTDFMLERYKDPLLIVSLKGVPARPWLEPGDRVKVTETQTGLNEWFYIARMPWSWKPGKHSYLMDLDLIRIKDLFKTESPDNYTYAQVGVSHYGNTARLFW